MVYLYAGLGIVMISGITAMMQVANNVSNFTLISAIKTDKYVTADLAKHDRRFLKIINDPTAPKSDICKYIYSQIEMERLSLLNQGISSEQINKIAPIYLDSLSIDDKVVPYRTNSKDKRISGSCVLVNNDLKHRVLINKNTSSTNNIYDYSMFSCYFEDKDICDFEENK